MQLKEAVPWGRSLEEYRLMFGLAAADFNTEILGCGDGPASFNAELTALGHSIVSIDPIYQFSSEQIRQRVRETYDVVIAQVQQNPDRYVWKHFRDPDELGQARLMTMERFLLDYEAGKAANRYLPQSLPDLSLETDRFGLCVCSHLLFLYSEQLSLEFHLASIRELLRVSRELRIFPLLQLNCEPSPYLEPVMRSLSSEGFNVQIQSVVYEFQKGGNQMLRIWRST